MTDWLRRAGRGVLPDGSNVTWSMAEGRRGRRWRESRTVGEGIVSSLLLETGADRRFAHLELSTAAGLLTLHPEGDGTLHGNSVTDAGVAHVVAVAWPDDSVLLVEGSVVASAAAAWQTGPDARDDEERACVIVRLDLGLDTASIGGKTLAQVDADTDGLPLLTDGHTWELELEPD